MSTSVDAGELRCVGALRAAENCIGCHQDKTTGDLLGAFSYRLSERK